MKILIKPFDTLFFRDGKPFDMGEETIASTNYLPSPLTIHGALTSLLISQNKVPLDEAKKLKNSIKITDISIVKENNILYPIPLDILIDEEENKAYLLNKNSEKIFHNINNIKNLLFTDKTSLKSKNVFISEVDLEDYLNNKKEIYYENEIHSYEYKIGIGLNRKINTVEEGKLYRVPLVRLNDEVKFLVEFEILNGEFKNISLNDLGYIKLGGENKVSFYKKVSNANHQMDINKDKFKGIFKLYLKTPAIFKNGYIADWMLKGEYKGLTFNFLTCTVGRYKTIGGFDMKDNKIKTTLKAVPEGSVYYFETKETDLEKITQVFEEESISDFYKNEGFGLVLVGIGG